MTDDERRANGEGPIPPAVLKGLKRYRDERGRVGGFLTAALSGSFVHAVCRADSESFQAIRTIARWIHNELPSLSHGSEAKVKAWREAKLADRRKFEVASEELDAARVAGGYVDHVPAGERTTREDHEEARRNRLIADAADGDPGEAGEAEVLAERDRQIAKDAMTYLSRLGSDDADDGWRSEEAIARMLAEPVDLLSDICTSLVDEGKLERDEESPDRYRKRVH